MFTLKHFPILPKHSKTYQKIPKTSRIKWKVSDSFGMSLNVCLQPKKISMSIPLNERPYPQRRQNPSQVGVIKHELSTSVSCIHLEDPKKNAEN